MSSSQRHADPGIFPGVEKQCIALYGHLAAGGRAAGQGGRDLRKGVVLAHNRLALPRSAASEGTRRIG
eukprot:894388-Prymnesium_polylepis.1